jgi:cellulose synthase/poly-beta-1,6-N-acetylglucosamine synthase-like glycosyltransferase
MNMLVALLTSRDVEKLKRCIESVLPQTSDVVVVCNTLDFSFVEQARSVAEEYNVEFLVTESNGTPAKGKNSVLEYFNTTDYTHLMQIDGDDYIMPDAIEKINSIVEQNPEVDVIGITHNYMLFQGKEYTLRDFFRSQEIYEFAGAVEKGHQINLFSLGKFMASTLNFNRMVLYSKKATNSFKFDLEFHGSEDVVAYFELYYNPNINYVLTDEHIYIYDMESGGNFQDFLKNNNTIRRVLKKIRSIACH